MESRPFFNVLFNTCFHAARGELKNGRKKKKTKKNKKTKMLLGKREECNLAEARMLNCLEYVFQSPFLSVHIVLQYRPVYIFISRPGPPQNGAALLRARAAAVALLSCVM